MAATQFFSRGTLAGLALLAMAAAACDEDDDGPTGPRGPFAGGGASSDAVCDGDDRAPVLKQLRASPNVLWPPDHQMVRVDLHPDASDPCTPLAYGIVSVTSNQPVNGTGDGDTAPDWEITGPLALRLRAERAGDSGTRIYTVTLRIADGVGNEALEPVRVRVPHDQGND